MFRRLLARWRARRTHDDLVEELATHRQLTATRLRQSGMPMTAVDAESRRILGNVTLAREKARAVWLAPWIEGVCQDARYALRHLRKHPGFTLTAGCTLVLATTLNTSLFTVFNAIVLKPWPVADPNTVVKLSARSDDDRRTITGFSLADVAYLRQHGRSFSGLITYAGGGSRVGASPGSNSHHVMSTYVSGDFFRALGIGMAAGRSFLPEEDRMETPVATAVLGNALWQRAFGADLAVIGRTIYVNDMAVVVVGVAKRGLAGLYPFTTELWMPTAALRVLQPSHHLISGSATMNCCVGVAGRLTPGATVQSASTETELLIRQLDSDQHRGPRSLLLTGTRPFEQQSRGVRPMMLLFAAVVAVLLLACANVGNLQLARAVARRPELSVRLSLGASRRRIVQQLLTETLVLAMFAGLVGLVVAQAIPYMILGATGDRSASDLTPDAALLVFAVALCGITTLIVGLAPALRGTRDAAAFVAVERMGLGLRRPALRTVLLSGQVALSTTLLLAASLLTRGLLHGLTTDRGFDVGAVTIVTVTWPPGASDAARSATFVADLREALTSASDRLVGLADAAPLQPSRLMTDVRRLEDPPGNARTVHLRPVSTVTFEVLGIPFVAGRAFSEARGAREVVVNETFARTVWPGAAAVGKKLVQGAHTYDVVGVTRDVQFTDLGPIEPVLHQPITVGGNPRLLVRSQPADIAVQARAIAHRLDPRAALTVAPLNANIREALSNSYAGVAVSWALGALALLLAVVGVFGVFSYLVAERTREIGIRLALGAGRSEIIRLVFGATRGAVLSGLGAALLLSVAAGQTLRAFLFGLSPFDPAAYTGAAALLTAAALVATFIPVRRAMRVDPAVVLRLQ